MRFLRCRCRSSGEVLAGGCLERISVLEPAPCESARINLALTPHSAPAALSNEIVSLITELPLPGNAPDLRPTGPVRFGLIRYFAQTARKSLAGVCCGCALPVRALPGPTPSTRTRKPTPFIKLRRNVIRNKKLDIENEKDCVQKKPREVW